MYFVLCMQVQDIVAALPALTLEGFVLKDLLVKFHKNQAKLMQIVRAKNISKHDYYYYKYVSDDRVAF